MRNLKRALSLALAAMMLIGMMVVSAGAASKDFTDSSEIKHTEAVEVMTALNVISGKEDGSYFDPTGTLTRAEMAKIISYVMNGGVEPVLGTKVVPTYSDIDGHWAEAYIEYCTSMGIIVGDGTGKFNPEGTLTASQCAKMFLTAMGYNAEVFGFVGNSWETNTNRYANEAGLYKELGGLQPSQPISRDNAAQMAYNAIQATLMVRSWSQDMATGQITEGYALDDGGANLLSEKFNASIRYGYMTDVDYNDDKGEYTYSINDGANFGAAQIDAPGVTNEVGYNGLLTTDLDVSNLYGRKVKVIFKNNTARDVYGIYAYESTVLGTGVIGDLPDDLTATDTSMKISGTTYRFDDDAAATYLYRYIQDNGNSTYNNMVALSGLPLEWNYELIDNDNNGKINAIVVYPFTVAKVAYVGTDSFNTSANAIMGVTANTGIKFDDVNVYEGIAKNDYVKIVAGANSVNGDPTYTKIDTVVEGKVEATGTGTVEVAGESYSYDDSNAAATYALGSTYKFVVVNGYICAFDSVVTGADVSEYAVVTRAAGAGGVNDNQVELLFTDGTKKIVDSAYNYSGNYASSFTADADTPLVGALVTFEIVDGKYELTAADTLISGINGTSGFDVTVSGSYNYASGGKSDINGYYIADDAVVFTYNGTKYSVITGAALKKYADASVSAVTNAFADKAADGFNNVVLAYVTVPASVDVQTNLYGYVTSGLSTVKNADNETVSRLSMWTTEGQLTNILADSNLAGTVSKGSVVTYTVNDDGSYTIKLAEVKRAAVLAYNSSNGMVRFTDSTLDSDGSNVNLEVTSDTVILGINSSTNTGVEGAEITTAVETATATVYQANAYYYTTSGTELDVIVIDVYADLPAMAGKTVVPSSVTTQAGLAGYLDGTYANVEFNADNLASAATVTVPEGVTLKVTDVDATNALNVTVADGATLDISSLAADAEANQLVATVQPGATFKYDNGTLIGEGGYLDSTNSITVKNAASNTLDVTLTGTVTLKKDLVIGAGDTINATGATIKGDAAGRQIVVRDETKITGQDSTNFYVGTVDTTADAVANGTYVWTLDIDSATEGNQSGWVK